jgi:hypothetical protein
MPNPNFLLRCRNRVLLRLHFSIFIVIVLSCAGANAQSAPCTPVQVDEAVGKLHMTKSPMEFQDYAEFRQLSGGKMGAPGIPMSQVSVFQIDVDSSGKTTTVKTISGTHEYSNLFADILKRVSYFPFKERGEPVCVRYVYKIPAPEEKRASWDKFHSLIQRCSDLSRSGAGAAELISACEQAADAGGSVPSSYFSMDKRLAYVTTATALMRDDRAKEALPYAEKAVEIADLGFDDISGKAVAYGVRGQARGLTGDLHDADQDLSKAEELERATFEVPRKPDVRAFDKHALRSMLGFHAELLAAVGKKLQADKLRDEAKKL